MKYCSNCKKKFDAEDEFCPICVTTAIIHTVITKGVSGIMPTSQ